MNDTHTGGPRANEKKRIWLGQKMTYGKHKAELGASLWRNEPQYHRVVSRYQFIVTCLLEPSYFGSC